MKILRGIGSVLFVVVLAALFLPLCILILNSYVDLPLVNEGFESSCLLVAIMFVLFVSVMHVAGGRS